MMKSFVSLVLVALMLLCDYWHLSETCLQSRDANLFHNSTTVFFAIFMSFWAVLFLEMWKRYSAEITHRWDLTGFDTQEEHPRPQYLARLTHVTSKRVRTSTVKYFNCSNHFALGQCSDTDTGTACSVLENEIPGHFAVHLVDSSTRVISSGRCSWSYFVPNVNSGCSLVLRRIDCDQLCHALHHVDCRMHQLGLYFDIQQTVRADRFVAHRNGAAPHSDGIRRFAHSENVPAPVRQLLRFHLLHRIL